MAFREFRRSGNLPTLAACLGHFEVSFMVWLLVGALGAYIASDLGLTAAQKGLMVAVPPLGGAGFRIVVGALADRYGPRRVGMASLAMSGLPLVWGALAGGTYAQVLAIGFLLGIAGASFAVALPLASRWYPPQYQGLALGIAGAGNSGTIITTLLAPRVAEHVGWHGVFALALAPVAVMWVLFMLFAREPAPSGGADTAVSRPTTARTLAGEADARWLAGFYAVTFGGFVGLSGYLPIFFVDRFGMTKVAAATAAAVCAGSGSLARPFGGWLADRKGGTTVLFGVLAGVMTLTASVATGPTFPATLGLLMATMATLGLGNGAVFQLVPRRFPHQVGAITGLVGAAGGVGGFALPFGMGALAGVTGSFSTGFAAFAAVAGLALAGVSSRQRAWRTTVALEGAA